MARYAIGDVQGCYQALTRLLDQISFDQNRDELWFAGDLVNRGPDSLDCLRLIKSLGNQGGHPAKVILGNHDLHLLATYYLKRQPKRKDTFAEIFAADDCHELMTWLRHQPLMIWDKEQKLAMSHAGIPHIWSTEQAYRYNQEVSNELCRGDYEAFFDLMYGNEPALWSEHHTGMMRLRAITNYFTRMRFVKQNGALDFAVKETLDDAPDNYVPWFSLPRPDNTMLIFGHWAALSGNTGLTGANKDQFQAIDTGCVWGGSLTALNIDTKERFAYEA
ncbi:MULTISPECIES: symmetrical bis(5'-nucleosyl)-tetraphosphatase [unclassified Oleiphilus]|uniref:symmetrical bis(5'-nucleosyl)-tetraphosphatase n=3 Tax=Oleiphilus TaxID=141450 RepID=UPI0007C1FC39|nr:MULTISPECIES: symmetrical bis(5'-nucleosyl)-tetraphosphatase [unclassified Oleiphilus]KZY44157.1 diadenosine tetraphosphatase [Oleiphilus sp. HI0050]KZY76222.1 diadenosine tetraphosphatase [Oleiphilus sp. HI0068]KZY80013.1 diadenosine tetraphosphatase [Oleiphilus sp. HI0069]KZY87414.1 diadenosine tetraphosphatase [Oleiphilus sp. HI0072]KZZ14723.1 diadenosine tetraphosphatase [Oleiphilus sp. HI0078]KZZ18346.1 diadenosine tetraphosphatase [Oleiphilus sp. HI0081]KZZ32433.1 diadenosine tetrap